MAKDRTYWPIRSNAGYVEYIGEVLKASCKVLQQPTPDTLLGRKTYEAFPKEGDQAAQGRLARAAERCRETLRALFTPLVL